MKKISTFLLLFVASLAFLGLTSCSSDDSSSPEPQNLLLGEWKLDKVDNKTFKDGVLFSDVKDINVSPLVLKYTIRADNTYDHYIFDPATEEQEEINIFSTGTYKTDGVNLTFTIENSSIFQKIVLNDENNLHLSYLIEEIKDETLVQVHLVHKFTKVQ